MFSRSVTCLIRLFSSSLKNDDDDECDSDFLSTIYLVIQLTAGHSDQL